MEYPSASRVSSDIRSILETVIQFLTEEVLLDTHTGKASELLGEKSRQNEDS